MKKTVIDGVAYIACSAICNGDTERQNAIYCVDLDQEAGRTDCILFGNYNIDELDADTVENATEYSSDYHELGTVIFSDGSRPGDYVDFNFGTENDMSL